MRSLYALVPAALLAAWLMSVELAVQSTPEPPDAQALFVPPADRPIYRYSVVLGGVRDGQEVAQQIEIDPVVREHYKRISVDDLTPLTLGEIHWYASYRKNGRVYWTRKPVTVPAGERLLTDGSNVIRVRCGNLLSYFPMLPVAAVEPHPGALDELVAREIVNTPAGPALALPIRHAMWWPPVGSPLTPQTPAPVLAVVAPAGPVTNPSTPGRPGTPGIVGPGGGGGGVIAPVIKPGITPGAIPPSVISPMGPGTVTTPETGKPTSPLVPVTPPANPGTPTPVVPLPTLPGNPMLPVNPGPGMPANPQTPGTPVQPGTDQPGGDTPAVPTLPGGELPSMPVTPGGDVPQVPTPEQPIQPDVPGTPDTPGKPVPEMPVTPVPEPSTYALVGAGLAAMAWMRRKR